MRKPRHISKLNKLKLSGWTATGLLLAAALAGITVGIMTVVVYGRLHPAGLLLHQGKVSEQIKAPGYSLSIKSVHTSAGDQIYQPGTGYQYYVIDLTISNTGRESLALAPVVQTTLQDSTGATYPLAPAPLTTPFDAGPLAPGQSRTGELSYNVPVSSSGLHFRFDPGAGLDPTFIDLGR